MTELFLKLAEATDCREVDRIVEENIDRLPNPFNTGFLCKFANNAKRRILRIQREKRKSFINQLN
jgi:hypothetical protein